MVDVKLRFKYTGIHHYNALFYLDMCGCVCLMFAIHWSLLLLPTLGYEGSKGSNYFLWLYSVNLSQFRCKSLKGINLWVKEWQQHTMPDWTLREILWVQTPHTRGFKQNMGKCGGRGDGRRQSGESLKSPGVSAPSDEQSTPREGGPSPQEGHPGVPTADGLI